MSDSITFTCAMGRRSVERRVTVIKWPDSELSANRDVLHGRRERLVTVCVVLETLP